MTPSGASDGTRGSGTDKSTVRGAIFELARLADILSDIALCLCHQNRVHVDNLPVGILLFKNIVADILTPCATHLARLAKEGAVPANVLAALEGAIAPIQAGVAYRSTGAALLSIDAWEEVRMALVHQRKRRGRKNWKIEDLAKDASDAAYEAEQYLRTRQFASSAAYLETLGRLEAIRARAAYLRRDYSLAHRLLDTAQASLRSVGADVPVIGLVGTHICALNCAC